MNFVTIQNISDIPQPAYLAEGKKVMLQAYEIRDVPPEVSAAFLSQRPKQVQIHKPTIVPIRPGESTRWLANMTGSPFQPKELKKYKLNSKTGIEEEYSISNPLCVAAPVVRKLQADDQVQQAAQGNFKESFASPPQTVSIPPYTRWPFPISVAEWMERRDSQMDEASVGKIRACRAPTEFEPNDSWPHAEILVYARMVDSVFPWARNFGPGKSGDAEDQEAKKLALLHALFFRLVDENYALPPEEAFKVELARVKEEMRRAKEADKGKSDTVQPTA